MSENSERSNIGLGILLRLVGIVLGILSATALARDGFNIPLGGFLDNIINIYNGGLEYVALLFLDPAIKALFAKLHELFGLDLQLLPHWKHAFVLLWLLNASLSRARNPGHLNALNAITWTVAFVASVIGGALAGTVPLHDPALFWWLVAAFFLFEAVDSFTVVIVLGFRYEHASPTAIALTGIFFLLALGSVVPPSVIGHPAVFWWAAFAYAVFEWSKVPSLRIWSGRLDLAAAIIFGLLALGIIPLPETLALDRSSSPGLANFAAFVAILAVFELLDALATGTSALPTVLERWYSEPGFRVGLDILSVLGGASFVTWIGRAAAYY